MSRTGLFAMAMTVAVFLAALPACSKRVTVPPNIDLHAYRTIGMVDFSSNSKGNLDRFTSQRFVQMIQNSQPGVRILELGDDERVLAEIEHDRLDHTAIREIGDLYEVDAVIVGHMDVTDVKPSVNLSTLLSSMSVKADVEAAITARLLEARSGATMWTRSVRGKETVAHVGVAKNGPVEFGADDPEAAYGKLVNGLVFELTRDFRISYQRQ